MSSVQEAATPSTTDISSSTGSTYQASKTTSVILHSFHITTLQDSPTSLDTASSTLPAGTTLAKSPKSTSNTTSLSSSSSTSKPEFTHLRVHSEVLVIFSAALAVISVLSVCYVFRCKKKRKRKEWTGPALRNETRGHRRTRRHNEESPYNAKGVGHVFPEDTLKGSSRDYAARFKWLSAMPFFKSRKTKLAETRPPQEFLVGDGNNTRMRPSLELILADAFSRHRDEDTYCQDQDTTEVSPPKRALRAYESPASRTYSFMYCV